MGRRKIRWIILLFCVCAPAGAARYPSASQRPAATDRAAPHEPTPSEQVDPVELGRPALRIFTDQQGLPNNSVMTLDLDRQGYLWAGTQNGPAYYNGHNWTTIDLPNKHRSNVVPDILPAADGSIWFATEGGGIHRWQDRRWTESQTTASGLPSDIVRALLETFAPDGQPILWVGTREGLARRMGGAWTVINSTNGLGNNRVRALAESVDQAGVSSLWVATLGGISRLRDGVWTTYGVAQGLPDPNVFCLLVAPSGGGPTVWAGTKAGLARFTGQGWVTEELAPKPSQHSVRSLQVSTGADGAQTLWAGLEDGGLARRERGSWRFLDTHSGLPSDLVFALLDTGARDGTLWVGTLGGGLVRLERGNWATFDQAQGLPKKVVFSLLETRSETSGSTIWMGTYGGGLARLEAGRWTIFAETNHGLPNNFVKNILETTGGDGRRTLWVGTEGGLSRFENGRWTTFTTKEGLLNDETWALLESAEPNGERTLWVGTGGGLSRFADGKWSSFDKLGGRPTDAVRTLLMTTSADGTPTLWAGMENNGLARFVGDEWSVIDTAAGLPSDRIRSLHETVAPDGRHFLWVGTGGGAARLDLSTGGAKWETISSAKYPNIRDDFIYQIREDAAKRIYLFTNKGIARLTPRAPTADDRGEFTVYNFTIDDGLPSNECVAGSSLVDSRGRIWAGTVNGVAVYDPAGEFIDRSPRPLYLQHTWVAGAETPLTSNATLTHKQNRLAFEFALLSHYREQATLYRTELVGLDGAPTEWSKENKRDFSFLPAGRYTFRVWAKDHAGNLSGPLEIPFQIRPAPWMTWWAFVLYFLATAGLAALIAWLVSRSRVQRLLELERVRTRIATDLHDDIGASLSQIAILSEVVSQQMTGDEQAARPLAQIADTSRELVGSMSDVVWSINPRRDQLRDLVQRMRRFASEAFSARDLDFAFRAPEPTPEIKLDVDVRRQLYLIFKEGVNNIVRHSGCTRATIEFRAGPGEFVLVLADNGRGFDPGPAYEGNGINNMRTRARSIGGTMEIESGAGRGTILRLQVPAHRSRARRRSRNNPLV